MPVYEYKCETCGETFEELVSSEREEQHVRCLKCDGRDILRLFSVFGFSSESGFVSSSNNSGGCSSCSSKNCSSCK